MVGPCWTEFESVSIVQSSSARCCERPASRALCARSGSPSSCATSTLAEVVNTLMRRDLHVIDEPMAPYFQDVYDHVLRATEWTESLRDLVTTILETNLTIQSNRLNGIMKKVTSWAAVIAVPTAVTGFYGQNVPYPGFGHWSGFATSTAVVVLLSTGLYLTFKRRDWI